MDIAVTRSQIADPGGWLRPPSQTFYLLTTVSFTHEERWSIHNHNLYHHVIFDRTPPWYPSALRQARQAQEHAERNGKPYEWPWYVPLEPPAEWQVSVGRLIQVPTFVVTFDTAADLQHFEGRMRAAFENFAQFLRSYSSRPETTYWRL